MKRFAFILAAMCAMPCYGGVTHLDDPGQTLYVRIFTSTTASFAVALTEGTSNAVGRYTVTDAAILTAAGGTLAAGDYGGKVFIGTPSTSANDTMLGSFVLPWSGTAEIAPSANTTLVEGADATDVLGTAQSGDAFARLGAPAGASIAADIAARASQASVDELPTNAELSTALGTADDAVLAAIAALNNLSSAAAQAACEAALAAYKALKADNAYDVTTENGTLETTFETPTP